MAVSDSFENYRQKYPDGHKSGDTWAGRLEKILTRASDRIAFIQGDRRLTWKEFDLRTNRVANALIELGIKKEDRVAIMGFNSIEWMESYFGISKIGAVPVNLNPRFVPQELKHILEDSDSMALIMEDENLARIQDILAQLPLLKHFIVIGNKVPDDMMAYEELLSKSPDAKPKFNWKVTNEDFAFLFYTGGTTGYPKGTVWDGYNRVRGLDAIILSAMGPLVQMLPDLSSEALAALNTTMPIALPERFIKSKFFHWLVNRESDSDIADRIALRVLGSKPNYRLAAGKMKLIVVAPLFHGTAYETDFSMIGATAGTSIYLTQRHPFDPKELWETVEREKANLIVIVGDAFAIPMAEELERKDYDISSLSAIISSGVRWSPSAKKKLIQKNPGLLLLDELGSTETSAAFSQVSHAKDQEISQLKIKIVPKGINTTRVINHETGKDARPGERGELIFGGFNSLGYWKDPERTKAHFRIIDGKRWFYVGDQGTVDQEGYFNFIGRGSSIINTGGEKVYAEEVEEILNEHPRIRAAAVTGVPDERWGEAVTAIVEPEKNADLVPEEIIEYCRNKMAGYKKPKHVLFLAELPRSASGKIERKDLKQLAQKLLGQPG
jgi:acyl-CoA synthetase (AMP-forming)/AMP-acid ligase II